MPDDLDTPCSFLDGAITCTGRATQWWDDECWLRDGKLTPEGRKHVDPKPGEEPRDA